jgi:hypothetical protein
MSPPDPARDDPGSGCAEDAPTEVSRAAMGRSWHYLRYVSDHPLPLRASHGDVRQHVPIATTQIG